MMEVIMPNVGNLLSRNLSVPNETADPPQPGAMDLVSRIFAYFHREYGSAKMKAFAADHEPKELKMHWARRLGSLDSRQIDFALQNLPPEWPPQAGQFVALARSYPVIDRQKVNTPPAPVDWQHGRERLARLIREFPRLKRTA
jgi:hypothetical protein